MKTTVLRAFFDGACDSKSLARDLEGTTIQTSADTFTHKMDEDVSDVFLIEPRHLVRVCDAFEAGDLSDQMVEEIGFALMVSDYFDWDSSAPDGVRVAATADNWCSREINYKINPRTMMKFRHYLLTGIDQFDSDDLSDLPQKGSTRAWKRN
jgi:hypothetical protein